MSVENKNTTIQFKRTSENSTFIEDGGVIKKGEPFYDLNSKHLYVGNTDADKLEDKQHIAQVTDSSSADDTVDFYIGEDSENKYTKKIDNVDNAKNVTDTIKNTPLDQIFEDDGKTVKSATSAAKLDSFDLTLDSNMNLTLTVGEETKTVEITGEIKGTSQSAKDYSDGGEIDNKFKEIDNILEWGTF